MLVSSTVLALFLIASASAQPAQLPAQGKQASTIRVDQAGMYRISARSGFGTSCSLVDYQRGPFAHAGRVGHEDCELDLLLDEGTYRLRVESPKKAKGKVTVSVTQFAELFQKPVLLKRGRFDSTTLKPAQQASWWIRINDRRSVNLRVIGRTAGEVRLWRDGKWVEEIQSRTEELKVKKGQPLYSWTLMGTLEAGDYRLTAYGARPKKFSQGSQENFLFVANGFTPGAAERHESFVLPAWGQISFVVPKGRLAAFVALDQSPTGNVRLELHSLTGKMSDGDHMGSRVGYGKILPKALIPICSAFGNQKKRHVITVQGAPGTSGQLRWADYIHSSVLADNLYSSPRTSFEFEVDSSGDYLVAVDDVPLDTDAAPLSCELAPVRHVRFGRTVRDYMKLGASRSYERSFNYNGREASIWFEVSDSGIYRIETSGGRDSRCELYQLDGTRRVRLTRSAEDAKVCRLEKTMGRGQYQLKLYRGKPGIEKLSIRSLASKTGLPFGLGSKKGGQKSVVSKASCRFQGAALKKGGRYKVKLNRQGRLTARGLHLRKLPLKLDVPLPLVLDPGERLDIPLAAGGRIDVRSTGKQEFSCGLGKGSPSVARDGICRLAASSSRGSIVLHNPGRESMALTLLRPQPPRKLDALARHDPKVRKLSRVAPGKTRFLDFDRKQSHSMTFQVKEAGLYHLETTGLLATECRVRTPIFPRLAAQKGGGRGRNCLVAAYLRPGRYLLTAKTHGRSRGRGGVLVEQRPVRKKAAVVADGNAYFRVAANELVQQKLTVKESGRYSFSTRGQGVSLSCRLEDSDGWPLVRIPTSCQQTMPLDAGDYLWGQMPLTVESMRRTRLAKVRPPVVLSGNVTHKVALNKAHTVELGEDGKDLFKFSLKAPMNSFISLNNGMQGRIFHWRDGRKGELVEVIPPVGRNNRDDYGRGDECDCEYEEECAEHCSSSSTRGRNAPPGKSLKLAAGEYLLETEHARADVGIRYQLTISTIVLAPGLARDNIAVPSEALVRMSRDGVLRIKSEGETDVRCRLFDKKGALLAEGSDIGADWNCLLAIPVAAGDYRLVLEAENNLSGSTRISVNSPSVKEVGQLSDGKVLTTGNHVLLADLPEPPPGAIQEVGFTSKLRFSCALEDAQGRVLQSQLNGLRCGFLVNPRGERYRIRLWTRRWSGKLKTKMISRKLERMSDGEIDAGRAALVTVGRTGLYETTKKVWCLPAKDSGPLEFCGPVASLAKGEVIFSTTGPDREPDLSMEEMVSDLSRSIVDRPRLTERPVWQRQETKSRSLHLLKLEVPHGEQAAPACRIHDGVHQQQTSACFAASGPVENSLARWWLTSKKAKRAVLTRLSAPLPKEVAPLRPGEHRLVWSASAARYRLPSGAVRIELVLPGDAWAVQTSSSGKALDFCPPQAGLSACILGARGGELILISDSEREARVRLLLVDRPPVRQEVRELFERLPKSAGQTHLSISGAEAERRLEVRGAQHCRTALDDGTRISGCQLTLPAGVGAAVELQHEMAPLQAVVARPDSIDRVRWGMDLPKSPARPLLIGQTVQLTGMLADRAISLKRPAMVNLRAEAGICALYRNGELSAVVGQGSGCDMQRMLDAGEYRVVVRSFAQQPLGGSLVWTAWPVEILHEGIGREDWLAPGQTRMFSFKVQTDGQVGLGVRASADLLRCRIMNREQKTIGQGCQQFLKLSAGEYLLAVDSAPGTRPLRFRPVLLGLAGSHIEVPRSYLQNLFNRIGFKPMGGAR